MAAAKAMLLDVLTLAAYAGFDDLREELVASLSATCWRRHRLPGYVSAYGAKGRSCSRRC